MTGVSVMISWADEPDEVLLGEVPFTELGNIEGVVYGLFSGNPDVTVDEVKGYLVMEMDRPQPVFYRVIVFGGQH